MGWFLTCGFVYMGFSHFHHFGILKNSTIDLPISIFYQVAVIPSSMKHSFIVFWLCLHKLSHLFLHLKTKKITYLQSCSMRLSENVYNYYTQIKSQVTNKLYIYVRPKKVQIWTKKAKKWVELDLSRLQTSVSQKKTIR